MKTLVLFAVLALGGAAFAQQSCPMCPVKPQPKAAPEHECDKCLAAQPCSHCDSLTAKHPDARERAFWAEAAKMQAQDKVEHGELMSCCATKLTAGKADSCCTAKAGMAVGAKAPTCELEAHHSGKESIVIVGSKKGHKGETFVIAAPAKGHERDTIIVVDGKHAKKGTYTIRMADTKEGHGFATHKVFAGGQYHFFCCEHMANDAIAGFKAKGMTVGQVQKVVGKHPM